MAFSGKKLVPRASQSLFFFIFFGVFYLLYIFLDRSTFTITKPVPNHFEEFGLNCWHGSMTTTCPANYFHKQFKSTYQAPSPAPKTCPDYFRWIYEDLRPWRATGITLDMVVRANRNANFRLVIINGRAYVEVYEKTFQTRDTFTLWGILQLLRRFPGKVLHLDLMFHCVDWPVIRSTDYTPGPDSISPPPLFRYCDDNNTLDIVFPDWSFWGWPETNVKPWEGLSRDIISANEKTPWKHRDRFAYWRGNPFVAEKRMDLLKQDNALHWWIIKESFSAMQLLESFMLTMNKAQVGHHLRFIRITKRLSQKLKQETYSNPNLDLHKIQP